MAACFAIGVVEPASSGVGGGGYLVYQVGEKGGVVGFPMKGPLAARPDMYGLTGEAAVGSFGWAGVVDDENLDGPRSIAVPGAVAGLCEAHRLLGRLPLEDVVAPAVSLARDGHSPGWHNVYSLGLMAPRFLEFDELRGIFMPDGKLPTGDATTPALLRPAGACARAGGRWPGRARSLLLRRHSPRDYVRHTGKRRNSLGEGLCRVSSFRLGLGPGARLLRPYREGAAFRLRGDDVRNDPEGAGRL